MTSLHFSGADLVHPAVGMVGRSLTQHALSGDLKVASDSPSWKIHYFARGVFHWQYGAEELRLRPGTWLIIPPGVKHGGVGGTQECGSFYWLHLLNNAGPWPGFSLAEMDILHNHLHPGAHQGQDHTPTWQGFDRCVARITALPRWALRHACRQPPPCLPRRSRQGKPCRTRRRRSNVCVGGLTPTSMKP